jgi:hypothetical protein
MGYAAEGGVQRSFCSCLILPAAIRMLTTGVSIHAAQSFLRLFVAVADELFADSREQLVFSGKESERGVCSSLKDNIFFIRMDGFELFKGFGGLIQGSVLQHYPVTKRNYRKY